MSLEQAVWVLLVSALVFANIPWITGNRLFVFIKLTAKPFWIGLFEWLAYFALMAGFATWLEYFVMGNLAEQEWEFYATNLFLFVIFAFPGFIYRYNLLAFFALRRRMKS